MISGAHVAEPADVAGHGLVVPTIAAKQEAAVCQPLGRVQEEGFDARLAVRQSIGQQRQVGFEPGLAQHGMVGLRIEGVVDRPAVRRTEGAIGLHHRGAASVGQHHVQIRQPPAQRVLGIGPQLGQGGGGVHVPEDAQGARTRQVEDAEQGFVENADA